MFSYKNICVVAVLGMAIFISSCTVNGNGYAPSGYNHGNNNYNPYSPAYTGTIVGHVSLYDQYGSKVTTGLGGIQLTLSGYSKTVMTDTTGYYVFSRVNTGTYSIYAHDTAMVSAYGDTKAENIQFTNDTLNKDISLSAVPNFYPSAISATLDTTTKVDSVVLTLAADAHARNCIVFINSNPAVNALPANYLLSYTIPVAANATSASLTIPATDFHNVGIVSGASAYLAVYGYVTTDYSLYEDYSSGKNIYTAISTSSMTTSVKAP